MDFSYMHFYKHMGGFFMHSISSPEKLTRQLVHLVGKLLELERPSGSTWYVGLIRSGDKLVLQPGWNDFASANNVSQNDHLVFKFVGESKFQVFIFDPTGCEKGGSFEKEEEEEEEEEEEQEQDENLGLTVGEELPKEVHKFDIKEKDKQHEIQGEIDSSILNKEKPLTEEEQGGSETSNDSIPIEELRKILYQNGERQKVQGKTKMQQPNIATKPPSKILEQNEEEDKETSKDSIPIGKLLRNKTQKNKHYHGILGETETPTIKRRKEEQEQDENLGLAVGEELPKEVHKFDIKEKDKQHEIQGEIESSILNKEKPPTEEEQGGSEASNDSIPIEELRKILYQKGERQKVPGKTKMQQPNIATKPPSKILERNEEEGKETSKDSIPIGKLLRNKTQKNKHYHRILGETETPTIKRRRPNPSNFPSTKGQEGRSLQSCYNNYTSRAQWNGQQKSTAQQLACKVQDGNPYFHQILKKYNLTSPYRMCIPQKFCDDHLKREKLDFILYCPDQGKTWFVTSYFGAQRNEQILRGPTWEKFVKDNKLQECDLCVFELVMTAKRLTFIVHISRATKILDS